MLYRRRSITANKYTEHAPGCILRPARPTSTGNLQPSSEWKVRYAAIGVASKRPYPRESKVQSSPIWTRARRTDQRMLTVRVRGKIASNSPSPWGTSNFPNTQLSALQGSGRQIPMSFAQSLAGTQQASQLEISSSQ